MEERSTKRGQVCFESDLLCCICYICSFFSDFRFLSSQWRDARDALISQFNCLLSFQHRFQDVLSFN